MKYFQKIVGERLYLSPMSMEDAPTYTRWLNDSTFNGNIGMATKVIGIEEEKKAIERLTSEGYNFAIIKKEGDLLIGNTGFHNVDHLHRRAECGIFIGDAENRHMGFGTETLTLLLGYGFETLNFHSIMLKTFSFNTDAIKCYGKLGFQEIGRRRASYYHNGAYHDDVYMDMLADEFFRLHP